MSPWDPRRPGDDDTPHTPDTPYGDTPYDDTPSTDRTEAGDMSRTPTPDLPALPELDDDELEQLLRGALEARTKAEVPDHRVPPAIEWPSARAARRTWLTPLAVAASIAVVAAGGGLVLAQQHRTQEAPPATQTVTAEPTSASPTSSATGTPSTTATGTATGSGTGTATGTATTGAPPTSTAPSTPPAQRMTLGGASVLVPAGYSVTQKSAQSAASPTWCLNSAGTNDCVISFIDYGGATTTQQLDSDTPGGYAANAEYCGAGVVDSNPTKPGTSSVQLVDYSEGQWGGRAEEFRRWHYACTDGTSHDIAQYTVMTPSAYGLVTEKATEDVVAAMAQVVAGSTLPPATSTVRLYDHGIVRSVTTAADGSSVIALDRVIVGRANGGSQTYPYTVPSGTTFPTLTGDPALTPAQLTGRTVTLTTDGSVVTSGYAG